MNPKKIFSRIGFHISLFDIPFLILNFLIPFHIYSPTIRNYLLMAIFNLTVNGKKQQVDVDADTPILWVLRDNLNLLGTKYGCGIAQCGACTIHMDGSPMRSCSIPISSAEGKKLTTIEGLSEDASHPLQDAWREHDVPQCGYCQAGQIMSAASLLKENGNPSDQDIDQAMNGNLCRCGTYTRIKAAIKTAAGNM